MEPIFKDGSILPEITTSGLCPKKDGIKIDKYIMTKIYNIRKKKFLTLLNIKPPSMLFTKLSKLDHIV